MTIRFLISVDTQWRDWDFLGTVLYGERLSKLDIRMCSYCTKVNLSTLFAGSVALNSKRPGVRSCQDGIPSHIVRVRLPCGRRHRWGSTGRRNCVGRDRVQGGLDASETQIVVTRPETARLSHHIPASCEQPGSTWSCPDNPFAAAPSRSKITIPRCHSSNDLWGSQLGRLIL
jgi:hypothetical protein